MEYQEINKKTAEKMYYKGYSIFAIPGKYQIEEMESRQLEPAEFCMQDYRGIEKSFQKAIDMFRFCSCDAESQEEPRLFVNLQDYKRRLFKKKTKNN